MCYNTRMRKGQALLEYVLALAGLVVVVTALGFVVSGAAGFGVRTESLVSSEYP